MAAATTKTNGKSHKATAPHSAASLKEMLDINPVNIQTAWDVMNSIGYWPGHPVGIAENALVLNGGFGTVADTLSRGYAHVWYHQPVTSIFSDGKSTGSITRITEPSLSKFMGDHKDLGTSKSMDLFIIPDWPTNLKGGVANYLLEMKQLGSLKVSSSGPSTTVMHVLSSIQDGKFALSKSQIRHVVVFVPRCEQLTQNYTMNSFGLAETGWLDPAVEGNRGLSVLVCVSRTS